MDSRIRVVVRVRPRIAEDDSVVTAPRDNCVRVLDGADGQLLLNRCAEAWAHRTRRLTGGAARRPYQGPRKFRFDRVLDVASSQAEVFDAMGADVVDAVLSGYSGTLLAYGMTGSGKTYTMFGPQRCWDAVSCVCALLFARAGRVAGPFPPRLA